MIYPPIKVQRELNKFRSLSESASSLDVNVDKDADVHVPARPGFEGMSIEDYLGYNPNDEQPEGLKRDDEYGEFFRNPIVMEVFNSHMDLNDSKTRKAILSMNEAEQNSALTALTSRLYDNIVAKVDDIDYGEIPSTKGDITKLSNYPKIRDCIDVLRDILKEYKQDPAPINEVALALGNIETRKDLFGRAFRMDVELPIITYNNIVLSIINSVSYMIATCIEFIKTPNKDNFQIVLNKVAYAKTKSNLLFTNLKKFNKCCDDRNFDKSMEHIINEYVKVHEGAALSAITSSSWAGPVLAIAGVIIMIIPIIKELVFYFYYVKMRVSEFFDLQADLLQMNAYNVENNSTVDEKKKEKIVANQLKISGFFRTMANKFAINSKKAEVEATREIEKQNKAIKIDELDTNNVSALF